MPAEKRRIPATIAEEIGAEIVSGRLKPGAVLDGEVPASGRRRVSRSAYREAIRTLVAKGLVESRPKSGTRVSARANWHLLDPDVLSWVFASEPSRELVDDLYELRRLIEPATAALAAERRTLKQLNEIGLVLEVMGRETLHSQAGRLADESFHILLLAACGNPFLVSLGSIVTAAVKWSTIFKHRADGLKRDYMTEHVKVYEAVAARDGARAHAAMTELVELALADIHELLVPIERHEQTEKTQTRRHER
jgi:DNA-binding FadR family transcriptional regulator